MDSRFYRKKKCKSSHMSRRQLSPPLIIISDSSSDNSDMDNTEGKNVGPSEFESSSSIVASTSVVPETEEITSPLRETNLTGTNEPESRPSSSTAVLPFMSDIYLMEEEESKLYSSEEIYDEFKNACEALANNFSELLRIKQEKLNKVVNPKIDDCNIPQGDDPEAMVIDEVEPMAERLDMLEIASICMTMKRLNRLDKHCLKRSRDTLNEKKQKLDHVHLHLQNLQYEASYLHKEVTLITELKSQALELELLDPDNPDNACAQVDTEQMDEDMSEQAEHELMIKRLQHEYNLRKSLVKKLNEAEVQKRQIVKEVHTLKEHLDIIPPALDAIRQAISSVPKFRGFPKGIKCSATKTKKARTMTVTNPLHHLYNNIRSHCISGKKVTVNIFGDVDNLRTSNQESGIYDDDSGDSDQNDESNYMHHKHFTFSTAAETNCGALEACQLFVLLNVSYEEHDVGLKFEYLTELKLVTVSIEHLHIATTYLDEPEVAKILSLDSFLVSLLPGNDGEVYLPPHSNVHRSDKMTGMTYLWCQKMTGLWISSSDTNSNKLHDESQFLSAVILAITLRLKSKVLLCSQITALGNNSKLPPEVMDISVPKPISQLKKFASISWSYALTTYPNVKEFMKATATTNDCMVYEAFIERMSAKLTAIILVADNYPEKSPLFLLFLRWQGQHNSISNVAIRDMEEEINCHFVRDFPRRFEDNLLMSQMHHLRACLDIYVETEHFNDLIEGPREFIKDKATTNDFRFRARHRPYRFLPKKSIFDQRLT